MIWIQVLSLILSCNASPTETYFRSVRATDSTSYIEWGNDKIHRRSAGTFHNWPIIERLSVKGQNDKYIALHAWTGSDSDLIIVLPLNATDNERVFWNPMALDLDEDIVVYEYGAYDTVLVAENIRTAKKQGIGSTWPECVSAFPHYCIEDIRIVNRVLILTWIVPHRFDKSAVRKTVNVPVDI